MTRRGFSFSESIVVMAILVILMGIFIPYLAKIREQDRRIRCTENLRAIGSALSEYAKRNGAAYPQVAADPRQPAGYTAFTGADSPNPFAADTKVRPNDVTASLWLLVRMEMVGPEKFVCPSTGDSPDPLLSFGRRQRADQRSNFSGRDHLSYSFCSPFSGVKDFRLSNDGYSSDFAVMADRNPGAAAAAAGVTADAIERAPLQLERVNSLNHGRAGQNVLYAAIHVEFQPTPYCGTGQGTHRDNIYTAAARAPLPPNTNPPPDAPGFFGHELGPAWRGDSYLVPADGD